MIKKLKSLKEEPLDKKEIQWVKQKFPWTLNDVWDNDTPNSF